MAIAKEGTEGTLDLRQTGGFNWALKSLVTEAAASELPPGPVVPRGRTGGDVAKGVAGDGVRCEEEEELRASGAGTKEGAEGFMDLRQTRGFNWALKSLNTDAAASEEPPGPVVPRDRTGDVGEVWVEGAQDSVWKSERVLLTPEPGAERADSRSATRLPPRLLWGLTEEVTEGGKGGRAGGG